MKEGEIVGKVVFSERRRVDRIVVCEDIGIPLEQCVQQMETHQGNPLISRVLAQETSFVKEVEEFYGLEWSIESYYDVGYESKVGEKRRDGKFNLKEASPERRGNSPRDLADILGGFSDQPIDDSKIGYEAVREDYLRWKQMDLAEIARGEYRNYIMSAGGSTFFAGVAGVGALFGEVGYGISIIAGLGSLVMAGFSHICFSDYKRHMQGIGSSPPPTTGELDEYKRLHTAAEKADNFMENHYKNYILRKLLSAQPEGNIP